MILRFVTAAVIIHNILIEHPPPEEWIKIAEEDEQFALLDDDDELNWAMPFTMDNNTCHEQLLAYLMEKLY